MRVLSPRVKRCGMGVLTSAVLAHAALWGCVTLWACAPLQHVTRDRTEYEAYRRIRLSKTLESRLRAASDYLSHGYQGPSRHETEAWYYPSERRFFVASRGSLEGLSHYLAVLPNGPHRAAAEARVAELVAAKSAETRRDKEQAERDRAALGAVDQARFDRKRLVDEFSRWVRLVLSIPHFGSLTSELPHEFIHAFRLTPPEGHCTENACEKLLSFEFAIPENGKLVGRQAPLGITLRLESGAVVAAEVHGGALFSRLSEALTLSGVATEDGQARMEGVARALALVELLIEPVASEQACSRPLESPEVLARSCEGREIRMIPAGDGLVGEDRLVVSKASGVRSQSGQEAPIPEAPRQLVSPTP